MLCQHATPSTWQGQLGRHTLSVRKQMSYKASLSAAQAAVSALQQGHGPSLDVHLRTTHSSRSEGRTKDHADIGILHKLVD